ncbi:MAG: T9SS type A sorting domain-containing protein [bacterium]
MKIYTLLLVFSLGFSQINWSYETIDSIEGLEAGIGFASLKLDSLIVPHVVYYKLVWDTTYHDTGWAKLIYAYKTDNQWIEETVDSSLGSGFTNYYLSPCLCLDKYDNPHIVYIHHTEDNIHYLHYAQKFHGQWLDTILLIGVSRASLSLDTNDYPCIAVTHRSDIDTVQRIKYLSWSGILWDSCTVDYNQLPDNSPSLGINSNNNPHIAYLQDNPDSLKYVFWNGVNWIFSWGESVGSGCSQSLSLDINDYPHIAYSRFGYLYYTFWDGNVWNTEGPIEPATKVLLDLDSLYLPHIIAIAEGLFRPRYYYRDSLTWHLCGWIEPDPYSVTFHTVSFCLDNNDQPHVVYFSDNGYAGKLKYAKGTFVGIEENDAGFRIHDAGWRINIHPNISYGYLTIEYSLRNTGDVEIEIYDVIGAKRKSIKFKNCQSGNYTKILNLSDLASGVYFVVLKQNNEQVSKKFLLVK